MSEQTPEERIANLLGNDPEFQDEEQIEAQPEEEQEIEQKAEESEEEAEREEQEEREPEEEEIRAETIADLADHLGVEVAELYGLKIPVNAPDGSKKEVSLGEWKDAYRESNMLKAERQKYEHEFQQAQESLSQKAQQVDLAYTQAAAMMQAAEKQLLGELGALEQLQHTEPTQYVLKKQKLMEKQNELKSLTDQAIANANQQREDFLRDQESERVKYVEKQAMLLPEIVPEWKDEKIMESEMTEIVDHLLSLGANPDVIKSINKGLPIRPDAFMTSIMRKAMLWDKQAKSKPEAKKKVLTIGKKVLKSGKAQTKQGKAQDAKQKDYASFKKRGDTNSAAAFIEKHLLGDM